MENIIDKLQVIIDKVKELELNQKKKPGNKKKETKLFLSSGTTSIFSYTPSVMLRWVINDIEVLYKEVIRLQKKKLRARK